MKARFRKIIKLNSFQNKLDDNFSYGEVIGDYYITVEKDCGKAIATAEYVKDVAVLTPYEDSFGNPICLEDVLIVNYEKDNLQREVKVYFDSYFGIYKVKRLDGKYLDLDNLSSWVNYSKDKDTKGNRSGVLIKLKIFENSSKETES